MKALQNFFYGIVGLLFAILTGCNSSDAIIITVTGLDGTLEVTTEAGETHAVDGEGRIRIFAEATQTKLQISSSPVTQRCVFDNNKSSLLLGADGSNALHIHCSELVLFGAESYMSGYSVRYGVYASDGTSDNSFLLTGSDSVLPTDLWVYRFYVLSGFHKKEWFFPFEGRLIYKDVDAGWRITANTSSPAEDFTPLPYTLLDVTVLNKSLYLLVQRTINRYEIWKQDRLDAPPYFFSLLPNKGYEDFITTKNKLYLKSSQGYLVEVLPEKSSIMPLPGEVIYSSRESPALALASTAERTEGGVWIDFALFALQDSLHTLRWVELPDYNVQQLELLGTFKENLVVEIHYTPGQDESCKGVYVLERGDLREIYKLCTEEENNTRLSWVYAEEQLHIVEETIASDEASLVQVKVINDLEQPVLKPLLPEFWTPENTLSRFVVVEGKYFYIQFELEEEQPGYPWFLIGEFTLKSFQQETQSWESLMSATYNCALCGDPSDLVINHGQIDNKWIFTFPAFEGFTWVTDGTKEGTTLLNLPR